MTIPPAEDASATVPMTMLPPPPPLDGFTPEEFRARREALRAACPEGILLLRGATEDEITAPGAAYTQNANFYYLTGVDTPGAFLVLLPQDVPASAGLPGTPSSIRELLFLPARNPATETWTGAKLGPGAETEAATGIQKVVDASGLWSALTKWLSRQPLLWTVLPFGEHATLTQEYGLMQTIGRYAPGVQFRDVTPAIAQLRAVKSPAEIARIEQAIAITASGQRVARGLIARGAGMWEYVVEARIFEAFRSQGARLAFGSIVGGGANGTVLHYEDNRCLLNQGELVVVDIGAYFGHYAGDLTRTYPVGGAFSPRQREIYTLVLEAHQEAIRNFTLGTDTLRSMRDRCMAFLKASPLRAKDMAGEERTMDAFMPHGLSHHLGMEVHDVGDKEPPLVPGNVITVEPGIYIPGEGIGVRIEDDYLVTPDGLQRLGPPLEVEISALEAELRGI